MLLQLLLFAFGKERTVREVLDEKSHLASREECSRGIQWLVDQGLLYAPEDRFRGLISPTSQNKPAPTRFALVGKGPRWQDIEPDGRIPIYFTPHMENHYPLALGMIAAAIAGCTMVLKPSEESPLDAILFAEMMHEAGFPPGVFNLVNGDGAGVGTQLSGHPDVDMVSFTGSTR